MKSLTISAVLVSALLFVGAGCVSVSGGGGGQGIDGGVYRSDDQGETWAQKVAVPKTGGQKADIANVSVTTIFQDPSDPKAIYVGTTDNGMFFSYDGGESWQQPEQLNRGRIPSIAVDPKNKCRVYVAAENKLLKTEDCSRTFEVVYLDTRTDKLTSQVMVDHFNPSVVWIANNSGDVLRSANGGESWTNMKTLGSPVMRLAMSPDDSRVVYAATQFKGVWRTQDGGQNFEDLTQNYTKDFRGSNEFYDMAVSPADPKMLIIATKYGLLRTWDQGDTWEEISLLTPPSTTIIYSVAIDTKDKSLLYYGTATTFYKSLNGGAEWVPKRLPSTRVATALMVDRTSPNVIYLGMTKPKN